MGSSRLFLSFVAPLVFVPLVACIPPAMPSSDELTKTQLAYNEKEVAKAIDPDAKAFWTGATECIRNNKMTMADNSMKAKTPYMSCCREKTTAQLAAVEARAAAEKDPVRRNHDLKVAACLDKVMDDPPFPYKSVDDCIVRAEVRKQDQENIGTSAEYAEAEKAGTTAAWIGFLAKHRDDKRSPELARKVLARASEASSDEQGNLDEELVKAYPLALRDMPVERRLLLVGPENLRVRDLKKMADAKVGASIVLARIRASKEPYKSFDGNELAMLKKFGISDDAVTAMIEVSAKLEDKQKDDEERKALRTELAALKKLIEDKKASGEKSSGQTVQTKDGPMDVLASCAKRLAAMKICDEIPFPGSTICQSATESEFPCPQH